MVAFENVLMKEVEAEATPSPSNGQLAKNSTLIGMTTSCVMIVLLADVHRGCFCYVL